MKCFFSRKLLLGIIVWFSTIGLAQGASFDCNGANSEPEISICQDAELSDLDEVMAKQFKQTRSLLGPKERLRLMREQSAFLYARAYCDAYRDCIKNVYRIRVDELCKISQIKSRGCTKTWRILKASNPPQIGRCHMSVCGWFVVRQRSKIDANKVGALYELRVIFGTSIHYSIGDDIEEYPNTFSEWIPIDWQDNSSKYSIFCSKHLPTVMSYGQEGLQISTLDFAGGGVSGALQFEASIYVYACHNLDPSEIHSGDFAKKMGYRALSKDLGSRLAKVKTPTDILKISSANGANSEADIQARKSIKRAVPAEPAELAGYADDAEDVIQVPEPIKPAELAKIEDVAALPKKDNLPSESLDLKFYKSTSWSCPSDIELEILANFFDLAIKSQSRKLDTKIAFVDCSAGSCFWRAQCVGPACGTKSTNPLRVNIATIAEKPIATLFGSFGSAIFEGSVCVAWSQKEISSWETGKTNLLDSPHPINPKVLEEIDKSIVAVEEKASQDDHLELDEVDELPIPPRTYKFNPSSAAEAAEILAAVVSLGEQCKSQIRIDEKYLEVYRVQYSNMLFSLLAMSKKGTNTILKAHEKLLAAERRKTTAEAKEFGAAVWCESMSRDLDDLHNLWPAG